MRGNPAYQTHIYHYACYKDKSIWEIADMFAETMIGNPIKEQVWFYRLCANFPPMKRVDFPWTEYTIREGLTLLSYLHTKEDWLQEIELHICKFKLEDRSMSYYITSIGKELRNSVWRKRYQLVDMFKLDRRDIFDIDESEYFSNGQYNIQQPYPLNGILTNPTEASIVAYNGLFKKKLTKEENIILEEGYEDLVL